MQHRNKSQGDSLARLVNGVMTPPGGKSTASRQTKNKKGTAINKPGTSIMTQSAADNALNSASKRSSNHRSHFKFTKIQAKSNRHCTSRDDRSRRQSQDSYLEMAQEYQSQSNHRNYNRTREKDVASMQSKRSKARSSQQPSKIRRHDRGIRTSRAYSLEDDVGYDFSKNEGAGHKDKKYQDSNDEHEILSQDENERHTHLKRVVDDSYDAQRLHLKPATKRTSIDDYGEDIAREITQNLDHNSGLSRKHRKGKTYSNKKNRDTSIHTEQEDGIESVTSSVAASFQGKGNGIYSPSIDSDSSDFESNTKKRKSSKTSPRNDPSGSWTPKNKKNRKTRNSYKRDRKVLMSSSRTSPARLRRSGRKRVQVKKAQENSIIVLSSDEESDALIDMDTGENLVHDVNLNGTYDELGHEIHDREHSFSESCEESNRRSPRLKKKVGGKEQMSASRIAIGSKIFSNSCLVNLQPGSAAQYLELQYRKSPSEEITTNRILFRKDEIVEIQYYIIQKESDTGSRSCGEEEGAGKDSDTSNENNTKHIATKMVGDFVVGDVCAVSSNDSIIEDEDNKKDADTSNENNTKHIATKMVDDCVGGDICAVSSNDAIIEDEDKKKDADKSNEDNAKHIGTKMVDDCVGGDICTVSSNDAIIADEDTKKDAVDADVDATMDMPANNNANAMQTKDHAFVRKTKSLKGEEQPRRLDKAIKDAVKSVYEKMNYLIMRIKPSEENGLVIYSNAYLSDEKVVAKEGKAEKRKYIVLEIPERKALSSFISKMSDNEHLGPLIHTNHSLNEEEIKPFIQSLLPQKRKTRSIARRQQYKEDETMLVYPFLATDEELDSASDGLTEASNRLSSDAIIVDKTSALTCRNQISDTSAIYKTHMVTIRGEDFDRLAPCEFLNDTLIDFWMKW